MRRLNEFCIVLACSLLLVTQAAHATTVRYILDQSNVLADGVDYLSVQISDSTPGQLDFTVTTLPALGELATDNYGIQSFGLSFPGLTPEGEGPHDSLESALQFTLPDGWKLQYNKNMSEAGSFDVRLLGTGSSRLDPLQFSVIGASLGDVAGEFAAHVAGFEAITGECGGGTGEGSGEEGGYAVREGGCGESVSSGYFYGGRPATVALPPAALLMFSGLLGMAGLGYRKRLRS